MSWNSTGTAIVPKLEKKRKDYAFRRQFNEKPSIIPGCPGVPKLHIVNYLYMEDGHGRSLQLPAVQR